MTRQFLLAICSFAATVQSFSFIEQGGVQEAKLIAPIATNYNLSDSQYSDPDPKAVNSWWTSSYIRGSDSHDYLILSHVLGVPATPLGAYRASIFDITDSKFTQFSNLINASRFNDTNSDFQLDLGDYYFGRTTDDPLGPINTYSTNPGALFNITFELSSPVILNSGSGTFLWPPGGLTSEWSMPYGRTTGWFQGFNNETVAIDCNNSFTWYDRQFGQGLALEWTWFELHLSGGPGYAAGQSQPYSIWFYPSGWGITKGFATTIDPAGFQLVLPATFTPIQGREWTSPFSNQTYAQAWNVSLVDGTELQVATTAPGQELADSAASFLTVEAFVEVNGTRNGQDILGFGLVEIFPDITSSS